MKDYIGPRPTMGARPLTGRWHLPTYSMVIGYAREQRRQHPDWSPGGWVRWGYSHAFDAMNPDNNLCLFMPNMDDLLN